MSGTVRQMADEAIALLVKQLRPRLEAKLAKSGTTEGFGEVTARIEVRRGTPVLAEVNDRDVFRLDG